METEQKVMGSSNPFEEINNRLDKMNQKLEEATLQKNAERVMTSDEVIAFLDISSKTLQNWMNKGYLPRRGVGKRLYFLESEIVECIKQKGGKYGRG